MAQESAGRRLAAILVTDVVGSSRLMEQDEAGTLAALKSRHREVLEPLVAQHQGRIFKVAGDGALVEFASAVNAVSCAVELQQAYASANTDLPEDRQIVLRVGVNLGDVVVEGSDLYGDVVNIAARLQAMAEPGGIYLSANVHEQVAKKLPIAFDDLGLCEVKNISKPVQLFRARTEPQDWERPQPTPAGKDKPSIAVLPFTNISDDPAQQYFSDGVTEDIITELSRFHSLLVIARNSSFQFRGQGADLAAVRRKLGVRFVVEGSIRKIGPRLRITAQLIDAESKSHLWAERYDRDVEDVFVVQDEIARAVAATVEGRVAAGGAEQLRRKPTTDWVAYDYLLRGRELANRYQMEEAEPFLNRAVELDPAYIHAHVWRAVALAAKYMSDQLPETLWQALAAAERALALDDNDARSHQAMGYVNLRRGRLDLAGLHFDRALSLNPNDVNIVGDRANWLMYAGRLDEALQGLDAALRRDPYPPSWVWEVRGLILFHLRRYDEALEALRRQTGGGPAWTSALLAAVYAQAGRLDEAHQEAANFRAANPNITISYFATISVYADAALRDQFLEGLRKAGLPE